MRTIRRAHRISGKAESCQTLAINDWQKTISDRMYREFWRIRYMNNSCMWVPDMDFDARDRNNIRESYIDRRCDFNHIEPQRFLKDANSIVLKWVRDTVERHGTLKINTTFNGEFVADNKRTDKSITLRNWPLKFFEQQMCASDTSGMSSSLGIIRRISEMQQRTLSRTFNLVVNVNKHNPLFRSATRN